MQEYKQEKVGHRYIYILHYSQFNNRLLTIFNLIYFLLLKGNCVWDYVFSSHINVTGILGILLRLRVFKKGKFIARESTTPFQRFKGIKLLQYKLMYNFGYTSVDLLICQTDDMKSKLLASRPALINKTKIVTIANPVNFSKLSQFKKKINKDMYIVSAGRFIDAKAYDVLVDAFHIFNNNHKEYSLIILGDGELQPAIKAQCERLGIDNKVIMPGRVNNVIEYFKGASLCVVSSRVEGFPNVLLQMMSQNTKVVSTLCAGGIANIEGITTVRINDLKLLAKAMESCLLEDSSHHCEIFDRELKNRDISNFVETIEFQLK